MMKLFILRFCAAPVVILMITLIGFNNAGGGQAGPPNTEGIDSGLVAHWNFNGHIRDVSGNENHGKWLQWLEASPLDERFVDGVPGSGGKALDLIDELGFIEHPIITFDIDQNHSFSVWKWLPNSIPTLNFQAFIGTDIHGLEGGYWYYRDGLLHKYQAFHENRAYLLAFAPEIGDEIPSGEWFHLAVVTAPV